VTSKVGPKGNIDLLSLVGFVGERSRQGSNMGAGKRPGPRRGWRALIGALGLGTLALCAACGEGKAARPRQDPGWSDGVALAEPPDLNPDPHILEIELQAIPTSVNVIGGAATPVWTYNGTTPGPLLRAKAGDQLIVHFTNALPEDTSVHWHGIRLPSSMDGVPGHTQPPVHPGGTFEYSFVLPDEGLFWYHPHADSAAQVGYGLYGPILVEPADAPGAADDQQLGDQVVLVLSDMGINADGSLAPPLLEPDYGTRALLMGQEGNVLLVNGRVRPTLGARSGLRQRWRIVNTAKSRYYQLALAGHQFTRIGTDGGLLQAPEAPTDSVLIIPAGRVDVLVTPVGDPGAVLAVQYVPYDRGFGTASEGPPQDLFYLGMSPQPAVTDGDLPLPAQLRAIAPLDTSLATPRSIALTLDASTGRVVMGINGVPSWNALPFPAAANTTELWTITNSVAFNHPFHLHGFFFQPLDPVTGGPLPSAEWRDTIDVPPLGTTKFAVQYDDRLGMWMFHCHILDHADDGMMGMLMLQ
jgi:FtsP/CotA-like multicopper oxidase with cupredoxin domain